MHPKWNFGVALFHCISARSDVDDIEEWSAMFDHVVGDMAKTPEEQPRDMKDSPFGYYID